jgi:hypothetical protein
MQHAQEDIITAQMDCFSAIRVVLAGHDNSDVVDNDKNQDKRHYAEAQVVDDNMQQATNAATEAPCHVMRLTTTKTRTSSWTPYQLTYVPTMTRELNGRNLLYSCHNQMCRQPPRYCHHVAEPILYLIVVYFVNYLVFNY